MIPNSLILREKVLISLIRYEVYLIFLSYIEVEKFSHYLLLAVMGVKLRGLLVPGMHLTTFHHILDPYIMIFERLIF